MPKFFVIVSYKVNRIEDLDLELDKQIIAFNRGKFCGSGCGFGSRDLEFEDCSKKQAELIEQRAKRIKGLKVIITEDAG